MKVIFLDIDGVLNCEQTPNRRKFPYVADRALVSRFKRLVERTGARVVLTSTWRCDPIGLLAAEHWGIPVHENCPDNPPCARAQEVRQWLSEHPDVQRYVVLDDDCDSLDNLPLFQPNAKTGLTEEMAQAIDRYLGGETDKTMPRGLAVR